VRRVLGVALVLMVLLSVQAAYAGGPPFPVPPTGDYDLFFDQVELRPGVTSDIHVKVFANDKRPRFGKTVFAIPGWCHSAATWDQYVEALFAHPFKGPTTSRVVAINLPGHGESTLSPETSFGELLLDDYVTAILATLDCLQDDGIYPSEIIGHSRGGLLIQMLQERLVQSGSSLFQEYGISRAVLLAPGLPAPLEWHFVDLGEQLAQFLVTEGPEYDRLGFHFDVPAWMWPFVFFINMEDPPSPSPDAPTPEQIEARGYRAPGPLFAAMQMVGDTPFPRPEVSPGIFGLQSGTLLHVVTYADDSAVFPSEGTALFDHLVCCPWWSRNTVVEAEGEVHDRVHDLHISNPSVVIEAMSENGWFVW
jgi:pimeloyl-ACP methyl ester carboxylesterase